MTFHLSSALKSPAVYIGFQRAIGGVAMRDMCIEVLAARPRERILDVGCGPAYYLDQLGEVDYHGFDTDQRYIDYARQRFGTRGNFYAEPFSPSHAEGLGPFDGVMLMGLLHHLDDPACDQLLQSIAASLAPGGRVVALDTVLFEGQSGVSRLISKNDRGDFVRTPEGFQRIGARRFEAVEGRIVGDSMRIPLACYIMTMRSPRNHGG